MPPRSRASEEVASLANQLHVLALHWTQNTGEAATDLVAALQVHYPWISYYLIPRVGFVARASLLRVSRVPEAIARMAHRIEALPDPNVAGPRGTIYVTRNRSGRIGWLTQAEIDQGAHAVRAQNTLASAFQPPPLAPVQDMRAPVNNRPKKEPPTTWERLGCDEFGE